MSLNQPEMTIDGMLDFIESEQITSISALLVRLPVRYRTNFSLVEHTRATGESSLQYPRIILFGSDGRFLANVGTKTDDPKYNLLDVAELDPQTGRWEFSVFDFSAARPGLYREPPECLECHGRPNPRPIWGSQGDWPGVFGDNVAHGTQGEALEARHAYRMNAIASGDTNSPRLAALEWRRHTLKRGGVRRIARHAHGSELMLSNIAIGTAASRGHFTRLKAHPSYHAAREELLLLSLQRWELTHPTSREGLASQTKGHGSPARELDRLLITMGIEPATDFSLATLAEREAPHPGWKLGHGDLYGLLMLQVLNDLANDDETLSTLLNNSAPGPGVFGCPEVASNMRDVVNHKMLHLFNLQGHARYAVNRVYYALRAEEVEMTVFAPIAERLARYLRTRIRVRSRTR